MWDFGEPVVTTGIEITLTGTDGAGSSVTETTTTDASGHYEFDDLRPGIYDIYETLTGDWLQSYPALPGTYDDIVVESGDEL